MLIVRRNTKYGTCSPQVRPAPLLPVVDDPFRSFRDAEQIQTEVEQEFRVQIVYDGIGDLLRVASDFGSRQGPISSETLCHHRLEVNGRQ